MLFYTVPKKEKDNIIAAFMDQQGITNTWLALQFKVTPQAIGERLSKTDMDTAFIRRCSELLNHNFFLDYAKTVNLKETTGQKGLPKKNFEILDDYIQAKVEEEIVSYLSKRKPEAKKGRK